MYLKSGCVDNIKGGGPKYKLLSIIRVYWGELHTFLLPKVLRAGLRLFWLDQDEVHNIWAEVLPHLRRMCLFLPVLAIQVSKWRNPWHSDKNMLIHLRSGPPKSTSSLRNSSNNTEKYPFTGVREGKERNFTSNRQNANAKNFWAKWNFIGLLRYFRNIFCYNSNIIIFLKMPVESRILLWWHNYQYEHKWLLFRTMKRYRRQTK